MGTALAFWLLITMACPGPDVASVRMVEICENALDDDGDGLIDLNDPDCECPMAEPISLIPNPSFEEYHCCPQFRSELACADDWIQASEATTDYLHTCGWMGWPNLPPPLPFPDGKAVVGFRNGRYGMETVPNWKEYAGACLLAPLRAGVAYRFQFHIGFTNPQNSPPTDVVFFGSTDCENLPFGRGYPDYGCPTNGPGWVRLGSKGVSGANAWKETNIDIVPTQDIYAIAIGPPCHQATSEVDLYYFFDNLVLAEQSAFEFSIVEKGHRCSEEFTLQVPAYDTIDYQWYKDGIALVGETGPELLGQRESGTYEVRLLSDSECKVTPPFELVVPQFFTERTERICPGGSYSMRGASLTAAGIYYDTLRSADLCDSIIAVDLVVSEEFTDTIEARVFQGEQYEVGPYRYAQPGQYEVPLQSAFGCDSLIYLDLDYYTVFFPNAFSPNNDGVNDAFTIFGGPDLVEIVTLQVFDRWGSMVYEGNSLLPNDLAGGWDGTIAGQSAPNGVYVYTAKLKMNDNKERQRSGSVLLMR